MSTSKFFLFTFLIFCCFNYYEGKSLVNPPTGIRSDVIVTTGFSGKTPVQDEMQINQQEPGWFKRQLISFGEMTSSVGNKLGSFGSRLTGALDKICDVVKTIIPVIAAVCHVGQFEFCGSINEAPQELAEALAPNNLDLNVLD